MLAESDATSADYRNAKDLQASKSISSSKSVSTHGRSLSSPHQEKSKSTFSLPILLSPRELEEKEEKVSKDPPKEDVSKDGTEASDGGIGKSDPEEIQLDQSQKNDHQGSNRDISTVTDHEEPQTKSIVSQTSSHEFHHINTENPKIKIPLSAVTLQSILLAARAKSASKMSPKQHAIYQLSNEIILLIRQSLQSERDAYGFVGLPITSVEGHHLDRLAWWFWIIHKSIQDLNPPRGYILPALKMIRQDMSSVADVAVEMVEIQKNIHKQLHRMAGILNQLFGKHEDLFGVRDWESKLDEMRSEDAVAVQEKLDAFLHQSDCSVNLTAFEMKTLLIQHETNPDFKSVSLNKLGLKSQREFIKSCIEHVNSVLRNSCDHSVQAHQELRKAEKEIQESVDKLVRKLDHMRRFHKFRDSNCAFLLKKSLNALGLCFYEYIDMVRFIRKLGRFVLLASEHVLRHTNGWSHVCDVQCLQQLDNILEEFVERERYTLLRCFRRQAGKEERRTKIMESFEEYFQDWVHKNISTVQVALPMTNTTAQTLFNEDQSQLSVPVSLATMSESRTIVAREPSNASVEVTFISTKSKHGRDDKTFKSTSVITDTGQ